MMVNPLMSESQVQATAEVEGDACPVLEKPVVTILEAGLISTNEELGLLPDYPLHNKLLRTKQKNVFPHLSSIMLASQ